MFPGALLVPGLPGALGGGARDRLLLGDDGFRADELDLVAVAVRHGDADLLSLVDDIAGGVPQPVRQAERLDGHAVVHPDEVQVLPGLRDVRPVVRGGRVRARGGDACGCVAAAEPERPTVSHAGTRGNDASHGSAIGRCDRGDRTGASAAPRRDARRDPERDGARDEGGHVDRCGTRAGDTVESSFARERLFLKGFSTTFRVVRRWLVHPATPRLVHIRAREWDVSLSASRPV